MVVNSQTKVTIDTADARTFVRRLTAALRLEGQRFNVCFVDDRRIERLNAEFRGKPRPTDVLSFPWTPPGSGRRPKADSLLPRLRDQGRLSLRPSSRVGRIRMTAAPKCHPDPAGAGERLAFSRCAPRKGRQGHWGDEFAGFLGDIVISAETAGRHAALAGHFTLDEIRWLILHGLLHLLGYDHERDNGEMARLELSLRSGLGIDGPRDKSKSKRQKSRQAVNGTRYTG